MFRVELGSPKRAADTLNDLVISPGHINNATNVLRTLKHL